MTELEFSRPIRIDTIGTAPRQMIVEAETTERSALAARFGLVALDRLRAEVTLVGGGDGIACRGRIEARVVQACVASGDPVPADVDEPFALRFVPEEPAPVEDEIELDRGDLDVIGYAGNAIDVGEAVAQTLALALDPFPRAAGSGAALRAAGVIDEDAAGPFGALKALLSTVPNRSD